MIACTNESGRGFDEVVRRHERRFLAAARRIVGDAEEARDVVQEAYASALGGIGRFRGDSLLSTWLYSIVVNVARMRVRSNARRREVPVGEVEALAAFESSMMPRDWGSRTPRPELSLEQKEQRTMVRLAIARLPAIHRTVLVLRDLEERSTAEVAHALGVSPVAVKVRLHRARRALAAVLRKPTPWLADLPQRSAAA